MYPDLDLHKRMLEAFEHTQTCYAGNEITTEERLKFHFWARLIFSMVVSWKLKKRKKLKKVNKNWKSWEKVKKSWRNIARGTTDPGYWVYNLNSISDEKVYSSLNSMPWVRCASGNVSWYGQKCAYLNSLTSIHPLTAILKKICLMLKKFLTRWDA